VNFGGGEGPWDHATRLEKLCSDFHIECVGIADIDLTRANKVRRRKRGEKEGVMTEEFFFLSPQRFWR
jgi:hypothetical protein